VASDAPEPTPIVAHMKGPGKCHVSLAHRESPRIRVKLEGVGALRPLGRYPGGNRHWQGQTDPLGLTEPEAGTLRLTMRRKQDGRP
jgi:hypothetical protein